MKTQLIKKLQNLEIAIGKAGYKPEGIVLLNIYTTFTAELWPHFKVFQDWATKNNVKQALTLLDVKSLFETLKVESEATVVK